MNKWIKTIWHDDEHDAFLFTHKEGINPATGWAWRTLSELSQTQKDKSHVLTHRWKLALNLTDIQSEVVVTPNWGEWREKGETSVNKN